MIGIITLYYNNYNIGGLLQAYALQKTLEDNGIESEQLLVWHYKKEPVSFSKKLISKAIRMIKNPAAEIKATKHNQEMEWRKNVISADIEKRQKHMRDFMQEIPHSSQIYTPDNIKESLKDYSGYIVGSDQVWNDDYIDKNNMMINMLQFVPDDYPKISYAASIGKNSGFKDWFVEMLGGLKDFDSVSVREKSAADIIKKYTGIDSQVVLDPTLMLTDEDWKALVHKEDNKSDKIPYIFTYFLGQDKANREFAEELSRKTSMKIINFAHAINYFRDEDKEFADEAVMDYSPKDFIDYIAGASVVITDSFHATVFSLIFHRPFYTLTRQSADGIKSMNSRVVDLLNTYGLSDRLIDAQEQVFDGNINDIDFSTFDNMINEQRKKSITFIKDSLLNHKGGNN